MDDERKELVLEQDQETYSNEIKEIIQRAVEDTQYRELLSDDPDKALEGYNLTEFQRILITTLDKEDLEKLTPENLEEYFSADSAVYTPDIESELDMDEADEEDI
jgi:hypothetical protein